LEFIIEQGHHSPGQLGLRVAEFPGHWVAGSQNATQFHVCCVAEGLRRARQAESQLATDRHSSTAGRSRSVGKKKLSGWDRALARASTARASTKMQKGAARK